MNVLNSVKVVTYAFSLNFRIMDVPAWAFPNLCIGRTYDSTNNRVGIDIFPHEIKTRTEHVDQFSFQYKSIGSQEDVRDLFNILGAISPKIKANIFKVEGGGKYVSNSNKDKGVTEILAVMKCTTVRYLNGLSCVARFCQVEINIKWPRKTMKKRLINTANTKISTDRSTKLKKAEGF